MNSKVLFLLVMLACVTTGRASFLSFSQEDFETKKVATAQTILSDEHLQVGQQYRIMTANNQHQDYTVKKIEHSTSRFHRNGSRDSGPQCREGCNVHGKILQIAQSECSVELRFDFNNPSKTFIAFSNSKLNSPENPWRITTYSVAILLEKL